MQRYIVLLIALSFSLTANSQVNFKTDGKCKFISHVKFPEKYKILPAQLSYDGKSLVMGMEKEDEANGIIVFRRKKANSSFKKLKIIKAGSAEMRIEVNQVSMSGDGKIIVFNMGEGWAGNDMYLADIKSDSIVNIQVLNDINASGVADAYPCLSSDGLKLYYVVDDVVYLSTRDDVSSKFKTKKQVEFKGDSTINPVSAWVSMDEKVIFLVENSVIYKATRNSTSEPFSAPYLFTKEFEELAWISGISFNEDLSEMIAYLSYDEDPKGTGRYIVRYRITK